MVFASARRRAVALTLVAGAPFTLCASANAAWFDSAELSGAATASHAVTGATAGQVAVAGSALGGPLIGAAHAPGASFGPPSPLAPGSEDFPAQVGPGGAVLTAAADRPSIRRLHADGTVSAAFPVGPSGSTPIGNAAAAPSGALLVVVSDADGNVQLWRQPSESGAPVRLVQDSLPDGASAASVVPNGADGFVVVLSAPLGDEGGVRVRALTVSGATAGAVRAIDQSPGADDSVSVLEAIAGGAPLVAYVLETPQGSSLRAAPVAAAPTVRTIDSVSGEDASIDAVDGVATAGGAAVAWTITDGEAVSSKYGLLSAAGVLLCSVAEPFSAISLADRGGVVLAGITGDERVALVPVAAGCPAGAPQLSQPVPSAQEVSTGVDADGTLVAMVGRGTDNATRVIVDDVTAPAAGQPDVPAQVPADEPFPASVSATDPWGVAAVIWSVDGAEVADGAQVTIPAQPAGEHTVSVRVRNAAGLDAGTSTVTLATTAPAARAPTPAAAPAPAPAPTAAPAPVLVAGDTTAPVISRVSVQRDLFRPLATAAALPRGSAVRFTLSEAASLRATVLRGHSKKGGKSRCGSRPKSMPKTPRGGHRVLLVTRPFAAGASTLRLTGRDARAKRLPRGRYRVSLQATDAAGNRSPHVFIRFTLC
jgi:hypothetical protein